jgi:nucleotide-binding universal stress UspA family protein
MTTACAPSSEKFSQSELRDMIARYTPHSQIPEKINVITDTSDFFRVDYHNVLILDGHPYLIKNSLREGRFGIDDEPKYWVKRAVDLQNGNAKIIKLVFLEKFKSRVGGMVFNCVRSPKKEARILELVRGHPHFMHGFSTRDDSGNIIRIIDFIHGKTIEEVIHGIDSNHEEYFYNYFPSILDDFIELVRAIKFLHDHREKHGDIRRDHLILDNRVNRYRWIDFDFNYMHKESMFSYDLFGLGNLLVFLAGKGDVTLQHLKNINHPVFRHLTLDDVNLIFQNRVVDLKKIHPYIPESLNRILLHFSASAHIFYENTAQLISDLVEAREEVFRPVQHAAAMADGFIERRSPARDRHILIALDETENAKRALLYVADFLGGQPGVRATLLRIITDPLEDYFDNDFERADWLEEQYRSANKMLKNYRNILVHSGFEKHKINTRVVMNYSPAIAECILEEQKNLGCCTIVIGRRVISRKEEFLFGSTSNKILHAPKNCAVWIVE